jgi:prevent-host-death family protein
MTNHELMAVINVHEAKTHLSKLIDRAHRGEEVVISKGGKPWARLVPLAEQQPRRGGWLAGSLGKAFWEPLPDDELDGWER